MEQEENIPFKKVAVIGGGSWATAIVKILTEKNLQIQWWLRESSDVKHIQEYRHNPSYLSTVEIHPEKVSPTTDLQKALKETEVVFLVVPSAFIHDVLLAFPEGALQGKVVVSAIKGIMPDLHELVTDYVMKKMGTPSSMVAVVGGPCHAEEVAMERHSYLTVASNLTETAKSLESLLECRFISTTTLSDVVGVEYCAIIKNIIAIACGIARGLNYGDNFQSVLVANAMMEIRRFLQKVAPADRDTNASVYLGDLLVTTYSQFSRNRTFGFMLGRGYSVRSAQMEMEMVAEGFFASKSMYEINRELKVDMPISNAVYHVAHERISPTVEFKILEGKLV